MHIGRPLMMLKQYLDVPLASGPAWKRAAVGVAAVTICLAMIAVGLVTAHYVLTSVGAALALVTVRQGLTAIRHGRHREELDSQPGH
jgi:hypothetical protein